MTCACVFGAGGGIGSALVSALDARGDVERIYAASRSPVAASDKIVPLICDVTEESAIAEAARLMEREGRPDLVIVASGALDFADGTGPERSYRKLDQARMAQLFALNAIAPAMVARHVLPLLPRDRRSVFAALSARVGSIGDNRLGGWHSYRASKAALNMLIRNFAIELRRTHSESVIVSLHPGTVDTPLSRPYQRNLPDGQVTGAAQAAQSLLSVIDGLGSADSGGFFAWDGQPIPF
ncbi:SDR family NAD(P)-dependent oxidoreductase [Novosphingobium mathurense]|uniref:NAD(P)-dependent dehydrogenase, short-chain alcohol dehydrogenase family n=1 Tax=Novosphingobium mathurense TaxID=428990 RepID=A0A1U6GVW2_9SPHN|nr:SDR family NAD(P)-dependent oxidoreductase [Novosphingobium mathurense]SLJ87588.1 NAD(P)-dependent dehydrogenase, short-chain alcohol dehydrogenase family [Novosphingobium mathurense]